MDLTQLSQMVTWLDEEHRRDREELARLDQRLQGMTIENQEQAHRIQDLEGRLASTQAQLGRFTQVEQALQQLKNEIVVLLNKEGEARLAMERDAERARLAEHEAFARALAEIRKELPRFAKIEEELATRQAEDQRLGEVLLAQRQSINNLSKDLDERTRTLPYMVEQRAQDNKRIAQAQAEIVEVMKRTDIIPAKLSVLEERVQRTERDLLRIQPVNDQLRKDQQVFIEAQKLSDADRTRQLNDWRGAFEEQCKIIEGQAQRLRDFAIQHDVTQRALKSLDEFKLQMARDQKQVSELQRLAEERQRKDFATFESENEQRWKKEVMRWDYERQEQVKINQRNLERFAPIEKAAALLQQDVEALWRLEERLSSQLLAEAQRVLDITGKAVEERPRPEE
jgi:hypothetical protein